jgi:LTXXQ motif family protein
MFSFAQSATRTLAAATVLGAVVLAGPFAIAADDFAVPASAIQAGSASEILAQASTSPATTEPAPAAGTAEAKDPVEARIKELHGKLHITAAQQTQWDNLVQVMRDNAKAMIDLQKQRSQDVKAMTAIDAVKSYQAVIEAHEAGMAKFVPAFQALYDGMSDAQKKTADAMFRSRVRTASAKESK